jgi:hypothetical protein
MAITTENHPENDVFPCHVTGQNLLALVLEEIEIKNLERRMTFDPTKD